MLPDEARLAHDLLQLRLKAAALEEAAHQGPGHDFADLLMLVDSTCFRWAEEHHLFALPFMMVPPGVLFF